MVATERKKLAVLGGGMSALSSVFEITNNPDWKKKYESITVYQMGWRLGGKGASGRRPPYDRIEEHGLHLWMGFYNNSFAAIQRAYKELDRPSTAPLATWQEAFKGHNNIVLAQNFKGKWYPWEFNFPTNPLIPGQGDPLPSLWDFMKMVLNWLKRTIEKSEIHKKIHGSSNSRAHRSLWHRIMHFIREKILAIEAGGLLVAEELLLELLDKFEKLDGDKQKHAVEDHEPMIHLLEKLIGWIRRELVHLAEEDLEILRLVIFMDIGSTMVLGLLKDKVLLHPQKLDSIDNLDLREWLSKHGALDLTINSPLMKGLYDLVFAYHDGKPGVDHADFAAGTAIRCIFRIIGTYKGSIFWKMQAGMGDTVFTPLHQVLVKRGVKFKFFHKVKNLGLAADGKSIATILMGKQATVTAGDTAYDPYVSVLDLDCWPSSPRYDQLSEGDALKNGKINLESFYTTWKDKDQVLEVGKDFDEVIFGISIASIPYLCKELIAASDVWELMVSNIKTVRTMAFQVWLNKDLGQLGWKHPSPVSDAFIDPLNTWADMTQVKDRENYPKKDNVQNIAYFCGPMEGGIPPESETDTPVISLKTVVEAGQTHLNQNMKVWWPDSVDSNGQFDKNTEVDIFYRANIDPSERYVLSVKNSTQYRITGAKSGFSNLYLVGDWTVTGLNAGCIEACTMSGRIVSNALTGYPLLKDIDGLGDI